MPQLDERLIVRTPEAVDVELALAGLGSRGLAYLVDSLCKFILMLLSFIPMAAGTAGVAITVPLIFAVYFGYDPFFEVRRSGRTPGKRANGIRVVSLTGGPVTFRQSALRSVLRLVDEVTILMSAALAILISKKNQRVGDMAAGTLVVRETLGEIPDAQKGVLTRPIHLRRRKTQAAPPSVAPEGLLSAYQVSAVTDDELVAVRRFLERRSALPKDARLRLAQTIAGGISAKVVGQTEGMSAERLLEEVAMARSGLS